MNGLQNGRAVMVALAAGSAWVAAAGQPPAFPGAEGWGRFATGGRGGDVYHVTALGDDGPGSLRDGIASASGPRTIVFETSGTIVLASPLLVDRPNITIAGQTAPGDGIALRKHPLIITNTHDVVVRHLRVRLGPEAGQALDGIEVRESRRIMIDHCSVSWTIDEGVNNWHGGDDLTVQWCIISEPLHRSVHEKGPHGYGASLGSVRASFHHNLFAHCSARNPSVAGNDRAPTVQMDHRNSVIYNWGSRSCDGKPRSINVVNNCYLPGPDTAESVRRRIVRIDNAMTAYGFQGKWHIEGNYIEGQPAISADNWKGGVDLEDGLDEAEVRAPAPFEVPPITYRSALESCELVLSDAGATRPARDAVDARVVAEVRSRTGRIIDHPDEVGGWPHLRSAPAPLDSDRDGIPDRWEEAHGLNAQEPVDRNGHGLDPVYTNLEVYLNWLAAGGDLAGLR